MEFNVIKRRLPKSLDERLFSRLSILSIFAMLAVAGTMIFSQVLIQTRIGNQNLDSKIINLAGRQRMLSQKLSKECFILGELPATQRNPVLTMARSTLETLSEAHEALKSRQGSLELYGKNSPFIQEKFTHLQFPFDGLTQSADSMLRLIEQQPGVPNEALLPLVQRIRPLEADFLTQMDEIVFLYEREAKQRLDDLRQTELLLFVSALLILGSILVFILLPNNRMVTNTVKSLIQKEEEAQRLNRDINRLFSSLEASHKELSNLNDMLDEAALFCSTNLDGEIIHFSKNFQELFSLQTPPQDQKFQDFLSLSSAEIEQLGNCFQLALTEGKCSQEIVLQQIGPQPIWLEVNMFRYGPEGQPEVFVLCNNTTEQKIA
ncbi:MAG: type IV pili methyl-accepting chemotaxis transducer N-terminal domain-containing protein, partial [Bacteroidota bacterium]